MSEANPRLAAASEANPRLAAASPRLTTLAIPGLIRRNTLLLALSQAFSGAGMGLVYSIGPLLIVGVSGSPALAGLGVTIMGISRFVMAYPVGRVTDAYGRKPAMLVGLACALVGAVVVGIATIASLFPLVLAGLLVLGMGMNAAQQLRVAAADMYPPSRRAEGLGYVLTGSLVGVVVTPGLVTLADLTGPGWGVNPLALPWLMMPVLIVPGILCVLLVRPDPKRIAERLRDFYPHYAWERSTQAAQPLSGVQADHSAARRLAMLVNLAAQGNMAVVMVSSALLLHQHGMTLPQIAASSALHSFGMWAFAMPIGRLADRVGRRMVLLVGGIIATAGAVLATQGLDYWTITAGAFLVGVGWCSCNVAATVVIADTTPAAKRGRAIGFNDTLAGGANMLVPLAAGSMGAAFGVASTGVLAAALMVVPVLLLMTMQESRPGIYRSAPQQA